MKTERSKNYDTKGETILRK